MTPLLLGQVPGRVRVRMLATCRITFPESEARRRDGTGEE